MQWGVPYLLLGVRFLAVYIGWGWRAFKFSVPEGAFHAGCCRGSGLCGDESASTCGSISSTTATTTTTTAAAAAAAATTTTATTTTAATTTTTTTATTLLCLIGCSPFRF